MKKLLLFLLTALLMLPAMMKAQTLEYDTVGHGTESNYYAPFGNWWHYSWVETIYPADEINSEGGGMINAISWHCATSTSYSTNTLKVYLGTTDRTTHSSTSDWQPLEDLNLVYEGTNISIGTDSWQTINLTTPYYYDGESNLVIVIAKAADSYSSSVKWYYTSSPNSCLYLGNDSDPSYASYPTASATSNSSYRADIILSITPEQITCRSPKTPTISDINDNSATFSWIAGDSESSWDIYLSTSATDVPDENTIPTDNTTTNTYSLSSLTSTTKYYVYVRANCGAGDVSRWKGTSFKTPQVPATLPYIQDFEDETENNEWEMLNASYTNKWFIGDAVNYTEDGSKALYISNDNGQTNNYSTGSTSDVWAYRDIDFGTHTEYHLSFDFKCGGESSFDYVYVYVGAPAEPSGSGVPAGATRYGSYNNLTDNSVVRKSFVIGSDHSGVQRVYFYWHNDASGGTTPPASIDNIEIEYTECGSVSALAVDEATETSLSFHFSPAMETDAAWEAFIVADGEDIDDTMAVQIVDTTYEFTNLEANTAYNIYVRTDCGDEYSFWSTPLKARTDCPEYITVPYSENFDTYGGTGTSYFPQCWARTLSGYPYLNTTHYSGTSSLCFYYSSNANYAVMPELDPSTPVNTTVVSFMMYAGSTSYPFVVGVMDGTDVTTFTPVQTVMVDAASTWCYKEVNLSSYTGNGQRVAFKFQPSSTYVYAYIDNVNLNLIPTCLFPLNTSVSNVTVNSVDVDWTPRGEETSWNVVVVESGNDPETGSPQYASEHPFAIDGLEDDTQYDVYVQADCGSETSEWCLIPASFKTKCLPTDEIPYLESFEGATGTNPIPGCWTRHTNYSTTTYPYISSSYASDGGSSLYFYVPSSYYVYAASQALDLSSFNANDLVVSFDMYVTSSSYGRMDVGIMTNVDDINTMTVLKSIYPEDFHQTNTWQEFSFQLTQQYDEPVYVVFYAPSLSAYNYIYVDKVKVDYTPDCSNPTQLAVSNIAGSSALVSWIAAPYGVTDYVLEYKSTEDEEWTTVNVSDATSYFLTGLTETTDYQVRVSSDCPSSTFETTPISTSFKTRCYVSGEVDFTAGTYTSCSYLPVNNYYNYSLSEQIFLASEMNGAANIEAIAFDYYNSLSCSKSNVKIYLGHTTKTEFEDDEDYVPESSLQLVYSGNLNCSQGWNTFEFDSVFHYNGTDNLVLVVDDNAGSYSGSGYYYRTEDIGAYRSLYYYDDNNNISLSSPYASNSNVALYRSNVKFIAPCQEASCVAPNASVTDYTEESITLEWVPGLDETSWEISYQAMGDENVMTETVTSSPYTISGLEANTTYTVKMRSSCTSDYSDYVAFTVTTRCSSIDELPYVEDFESATGSSYDCFVSCWKRGTSYSYRYPYCVTTQNHTAGIAENGKSLYFYGSSSDYSYAATPRFDDNIDMSDLLIQFYAYKSTASYQIQVGVMSDPEDYSTFEVLETVTPSAVNTWELLEVRTSEYTGDGRYVAIRMPRLASSYMYVDDINIDNIPSCFHVENISASNVSQSDATITWTPGGDETSWDLIIVTGRPTDIDFDTCSTISVNGDPTYTFVGELQPSTYYTVYVRANCDNGLSSTWLSSVFMTSQVPAILPYFNDFENDQENGNWTLMNGSCTNKWYFGTATNNGGSHSMYISNNNGTSNNYTISEANIVWAYRDILFPANANGYTLTFDWKSNGESGFDYMKVYWGNPMTVEASNGTTLTDVPGAMIMQPNVNSDYPSYFNTKTNYQTFTVTLPGQQTDVIKRLYFVWRNDGSAGTTPPASVDNLSIEAIYCHAPTQVSVSNITPNAADITWSGNADNYQLQYKASADAEWTVVENATSPQTISNLQASSQYQVRVSADCGDGHFSPAAVGTFLTACDAITTVPFVETFDTWGTATSTSTSSPGPMPICWSVINTYSPTSGPRPYISSSYSNSAPGSLYFYAYTSGTFNMAITPEFASSIAINTLRTKFKMRSSSSSVKVYVGVISDPEDETTFVPVDSVTSSSTSWQDFEASLANYTGSGKYIAFKVPYANSSSYACYIDDLEISLIPNCDAPADLAVSNITTSSADIEWAEDVNADSWEIMVIPSNQQPDYTQGEVANTNSYVADNLVGGSSYTVYMRTVCPGDQGYSDWTSTSFTTVQVPAETPYFCDFDDATESGQWTLYNQNATNKWYIGHPSGTDDNVLFISNDGVSTNYSLTNPSVVWAYRDITFGENAAEFELSFNWKCYGESSFDYLHAYIGDLMPVQAGNLSQIPVPQGLVQLDATRLNLQNSWQKFTVAISDEYAGQTKRLYFVWRNDGSSGTAPGAIIDSVKILEKNCATPYDLSLATIGSNEANLTFSCSELMTSWEYALSTTPFNPDTVETEAIASTDFSIYSLEANTTYYVYVRSACSNDEYSNWSNRVMFTTDCEEITSLPYAQNFDGVTGASSDNTHVLPTCWRYINTGTSSYGLPTAYSSSAASSPNAMKFYSYSSTSYSDQYAILPAIDVNTYPINTLQLKYDVRKYSTSYATFKFFVGVMDNPYDVSTFTAVDTVFIGSTTYEAHTSYFADYTGTGKYIVIMSPYMNTGVTYNAGYIDNLELSEAPTCLPVVNVRVSSTSTNEVSIAWNEIGSATEWEIEYDTAGFELGTGITVVANTNPFTVNGLSSATSYDFYVRAVCSVGDISAWSQKLTVTTLCPPETYPFSEDFEDGALSSCWGQNIISGNVNWKVVTPTGNPSDAHSGTKAVQYKATTRGYETDLMTPMIDMSQAVSPMLSFWFTNKDWSGDQDVLTVYYRSSSADEWTQLAIYDNNVSSWTKDSIMLPNPSATYQIRFRGHSEYGYGIYLDDITIAESTPAPIPVTCDAPTNVNATNIAQTSATINWNAGGDETSWNLQYKAAAEANWSSSIAVSNTPSYALTGLTDNTQYDVRVQAVCEAGATSAWTTGSFTTLQQGAPTCPVPTNVTVSNIQNTSAVIDWNQEANTATSWDVNYKMSAASEWSNVTTNAHPFTLTDLEGNTDYDVQVVAHCDNGLTSDPSETKHFKTTNVGVNEYDLDGMISVYPNPTNGQFTIDNAQCTMSSVDVYDVYGKLIGTTKVEDSQVTLDIRTYADGVYFVRIVTEKGVVTKRIVKK